MCEKVRMTGKSEKGKSEKDDWQVRKGRVREESVIMASSVVAVLHDRSKEGSKSRKW